MAKLSQVLRDEKRDHMIERFASKRAALRSQLKDANVDPDEKMKISEALAKLPRNSCPTRKTRRCMLTGRSKAVYRKFGLSRLMLRQLALAGDIPGVVKSSW